jgi:hypothetical protein
MKHFAIFMKLNFSENISYIDNRTRMKFAQLYDLLVNVLFKSMWNRS